MPWEVLVYFCLKKNSISCSPWDAKMACGDIGRHTTDILFMSVAMLRIKLRFDS